MNIGETALEVPFLLATNGKLTTEEAYSQTKKLYKSLRQSYKSLKGSWFV